MTIFAQLYTKQILVHSQNAKIEFFLYSFENYENLKFIIWKWDSILVNWQHCHLLI